MKRSIPPAARGGPIRRKRWSSRSDRLLADPRAREALLTASERVVGQLGGALERTLTALEPYLLQLRLEMGAANA